MKIKSELDLQLLYVATLDLIQEEIDAARKAINAGENPDDVLAEFKAKERQIRGVYRAAEFQFWNERNSLN